MTRRRNTINIYDYPEHLNPFREDADDNCDKFNTTGRRRPSFRVNAWTMFSPSKGKSQTSEDITPHQSAASRFMTWTPKLLRRSFRRSSPSRSSQWDSASHSSSRLSFRTPSSRSSLPPPGNSRTSLPPPSSSPHRTTPPSRPAPPSFRPPLSPSSTENGPNNIETNPVPPRRRALYTASSPGKTAGEKPPEDEVKYIQQGAKPKKKRRAPLPPLPPSSKSPDDSQQKVNSNETEVSVAVPGASNDVEEPTSQGESTSVTPDQEVKAQEPDGLRQEENPQVPDKEETPENGDTLKSADPLPEHVQNVVTEESNKVEESKVEEPPSSESEGTKTDGLSIINENGITESANLEDSPKSEENVTKPKERGEDFENGTGEIDEAADTGNIKSENNDQETTGRCVNGMNGRHNSDEYLKVDFDVVLHISEDDLRDKEKHMENGCQNDSNDNVENEMNKLDNQEQENKIKLHNGDKTINDSDVLQNETQLNGKNIKQSPNKVPEPKPRTVLPLKN